MSDSKWTSKKHCWRKLAANIVPRLESYVKKCWPGISKQIFIQRWSKPEKAIPWSGGQEWSSKLPTNIELSLKKISQAVLTWNEQENLQPTLCCDWKSNDRECWPLWMNKQMCKQHCVNTDKAMPGSASHEWARRHPTNIVLRLEKLCWTMLARNDQSNLQPTCC